MTNCIKYKKDLTRQPAILGRLLWHRQIKLFNLMQEEFYLLRCSCCHCVLVCQVHLILHQVLWMHHVSGHLAMRLTPRSSAVARVVASWTTGHVVPSGSMVEGRKHHVCWRYWMWHSEMTRRGHAYTSRRVLECAENDYIVVRSNHSNIFTSLIHEETTPDTYHSN